MPRSVIINQALLEAERISGILYDRYYTLSPQFVKSSLWLIASHLVRIFGDKRVLS